MCFNVDKSPAGVAGLADSSSFAGRVPVQTLLRQGRTGHEQLPFQTEEASCVGHKTSLFSKKRRERVLASL